MSLGPVTKIDCGCEVYSFIEDDGAEYIDVNFCPMHKAAPDLRAALEATTALLEYVEEWASTTFADTSTQRLKPSYYKNYNQTIANAKQALGKEE